MERLQEQLDRALEIKNNAKKALEEATEVYKKIVSNIENTGKLVVNTKTNKLEEAKEVYVIKTGYTYSTMYAGERGLLSNYEKKSDEFTLEEVKDFKRAFDYLKSKDGMTIWHTKDKIPGSKKVHNMLKMSDDFLDCDSLEKLEIMGDFDLNGDPVFELIVQDSDNDHYLLNKGSYIYIYKSTHNNSNVSYKEGYDIFDFEF